MKNKLISIGIAAALLAGSMAGLHVTSYAAATDLPTGKVEHEKTEEVTTVFDPSSGTVAGGSYYISEDLDRKGSITYGATDALTVLVYGQGNVLTHRGNGSIISSATSAESTLYDMIISGKGYSQTAERVPFNIGGKKSTWTLDNVVIKDYDAGENSLISLGTNNVGVTLNLSNFKIDESNIAKYSLYVGGTGSPALKVGANVSIPSIYFDGATGRNNNLTLTSDWTSGTIGISTDSSYVNAADAETLANPIMSTATWSSSVKETNLSRITCLDQGYEIQYLNKKLYKVALPTLNITAEDDKLTGFTAGEKYTVSYTVDENTTSTEITPTGTEYDIDDAWYGKTVSIVKNGNGSYIADSNEQELTITAKASASDAATASIKTLTPSGSSTSVGLAVTVGESAVNNITIKIGGKTVISYPANGSIEAGKTVNFGILVRRAIAASDITVLVDDTPISVTTE